MRRWTRLASASSQDLTGSDGAALLFAVSHAAATVRVRLIDASTLRAMDDVDAGRF
jgi:hypothetical protein